MALARWFGQPSSSGSSGAACPPTANGAKINKPEDKQFGLENFGNTCYVNSVLQALYFCHPFRDLLLQAYDKSNRSVAPNPSSPSPQLSTGSTNQRTKNQRKPSSVDISRPSDGTTTNGTAPPLTGPPIPGAPPTMFSALRALFLHISGNSLEKGVVSPRAFVEKLKKENELFRSTQHQDAHEFLIYLFNKIAEDLEKEARNGRSASSSGEDLSVSLKSLGPSFLGNATSRANSPANSTIVHDLFEGVLTSETRCLTCETVSSRDEAFLDLSIDIEQNSSVTACLRQFSASEMLCQKNKFFCDSCCGLQEAEKRMKIKRLPNVLALHLKRFKYQEDDGKYVKLAYRVAFPLELRLFNTADDAQDPDRLYELFAIVVHIGNGPHHGHYVTIVKSSGAWLVFDDDSVDTIKECDIPKYFGDSNSGAAYVLFYQALDLDLVALGLKPDTPPVAESTAETSSIHAPLLPPGLTHEGDSDASEFAPATPASPALHSVPSVVPSSPPPLTVTIPSPDASPAISMPAPTPTLTSPNGKTGFFSSLRHSPSKPSFSSTSRRSVTDSGSEPIPPLPSSIGSPLVKSESSEASTSNSQSNSQPTPSLPNGTIKVPKEKSSGWFTRKRSLRPEKEKASDHTRRPATAHGTQGHYDGGSLTSSTSSSRVPLVVDPLPNDPPPASSSAVVPASSASLKSPENKDSLPPSESPAPSRNGHLLSTSSPLTKSHDHSSHHHFNMSGHKKSQPVLSTSSTLPDSKNETIVRPPKRPSTAGAVPSPTRDSFNRLDESPAIPHIPSELRSPIPRPPRTAAYDPSVPKDERDVRRTSAYNPPPPTAFKRASRKLSFTSSMLGFVRKDRDRHKSTDNSGPLSPASPSVPGLSVGGRM